MYVRKGLVIPGNGAVILLSALVIVKPLKDLLNLSGHGNRRAEGMGTVKGVIEILDVKVDLKAGFVISLKHHGGFGDRHEQVRA